jgi:hypothetical protein
MTKINNLFDLPINGEFLRAIGATPNSIRGAHVIDEDYSGYPRQVLAIRFVRKNLEWSIKIRNDGFDDALLPSDERQKEMLKEVAAAAWHEPVHLAGNWPKEKWPVHLLNADPADLYEFRSPIRKGERQGRLHMMQVRVNKADGRKDYLPFVMLSDGKIHQMEPDDKLPLWGLEQLKDHSIVFLHEGAKAARRMAEMVAEKTEQASAELANHPWGPELACAAHLGWIGGASRAHDTDWTPIKSLPLDVEVILVLDRDAKGEEAARAISRELVRPLKVIRFGEVFPEHFDLADQFPPELFQMKAGRCVYVGPAFRDAVEPATWATRQLPAIGRGRPGYVIRDAFAAEWLHVIKPDVFIHRDNLRRDFDEAEFNAMVAPFSDVDNVARLVRKQFSGKAHSIVYEPGEPSGLIVFDREHVVNVFEPTPIRPLRGDVSPFLDFLRHLFPNSTERHEAQRWCATLIACPAIHMGYALLMISEAQGVGKSTLLMSILGPLVGSHNYSLPSAKDITESRFSTWKAKKRLAIVNELYAGASSAAANALKDVITEPEISVEEKFRPSFRVRNHLHIGAASNSKRALKLDDADRRWFIPEVTEETKPLAYWTALHEWLQAGGLSHIHQWAIDFVHANGPVRKGEVAPATEAKRQTVVAAMSEGERLVDNVGEALAYCYRPVAIRLDELRSWLAQAKSAMPEFGDGTRKLESPETIARVLRGARVYGNLHFPKKQFKADNDRFRIVTNFEVSEAARWLNIRRNHMSVGDVLALEDHGAATEAAIRVLDSDAVVTTVAIFREMGLVEAWA